MKLLVLLLAAAALAAGCVAPAAIDDVQPGAAFDTTTQPLAQEGVMHAPHVALPYVPAMGVPRALGGLYETGAPAVEPTIGVDKDGTIFMTGLVAFAGGARSSPTIMRSDDKGATWTSVGAPAHVLTFDPYVYVDPATGRVFQDDIQPIGCGTLSFSDDKGASWTTNFLGCGNPQVNDHQTLVAAKPRELATVGYPNVVYRCVNNVAYPACAMSLNGGISFLPQVPIVSELGIDPDYNGPLGPVCSSLTGHLKAAPDGRVFLPTVDCTTMSSPPVVFVTEDDGLTWTGHTVNKDRLADAHELAIAVDEAGNVYANWISEGRMLLAHSLDAGKTWSEPIDITAPGVTGTWFNAIAAGAEGRVALAYIGTTIEGGYEDKELSNEDWEGATWNAYITIVTDALGEAPLMQSVTANDPADPIARNVCGQTRCSGMTDFIDLVIDAEGRPWASFVDVCNDSCSDDPDGKNSGNHGFAATLRAGPNLRVEGALVLLPEMVQTKS